MQPLTISKQSSNLLNTLLFALVSDTISKNARYSQIITNRLRLRSVILLLGADARPVCATPTVPSRGKSESCCYYHYWPGVVVNANYYSILSTLCVLCAACVAMSSLFSSQLSFKIIINRKTLWQLFLIKR